MEDLRAYQDRIPTRGRAEARGDENPSHDNRNLTVVREGMKKRIFYQICFSIGHFSGSETNWSQEVYPHAESVSDVHKRINEHKKRYEVPMAFDYLYHIAEYYQPDNSEHVREFKRSYNYETLIAIHGRGEKTA